jgi:hypothetical protein
MGYACGPERCFDILDRFLKRSYITPEFMEDLTALSKCIVNSTVLSGL